MTGIKVYSCNIPIDLSCQFFDVFFENLIDIASDNQLKQNFISFSY